MDASEERVVEAGMLALWVLCERAGGTVHIPKADIGPISGAFNISWDESGITVSVAHGHGALRS